MYFSSQWFCILALQDIPYIYVVDDPRCFGGRARQNYFHYDAELGNCVRCRSRCPEKSETNRHNNFERREDCMKICKYEAQGRKIRKSKSPQTNKTERMSACKRALWYKEQIVQVVEGAYKPFRVKPYTIEGGRQRRAAPPVFVRSWHFCGVIGNF